MKSPKKLFNDRNIFFTPVIVDIKREIAGMKATTVFKDESPYFYPGVLTAYDYWKSKFEGVEESDADAVICDSSAVQVKTRDADIDPKEVAEFYDEYESIKIGLPLDDIPIPDTDRFSQTLRTFNSTNKFEERAKNTAENLEEMVKVDPDTNLYNVVQSGGRLNQVKAWYNQVKDYDLDGWCLSEKSGVGEEPLVFALAFMAQKGIKNVHILGKGGMSGMAVMLYAGNWFDNVTFDVSEASGYRHWQMRMPYNLKVRVPLGQEQRAEGIEHSRFPCNCPVCQNLQIDGDIPNSSNRLYELHNIYQKIMFCRQLDFLRDEKKMFKKMVNHDETERLIDLFDECMEKGVEQVAKGNKSETRSLDEI